MLFNKSNLKILQDLDDRGAAFNGMSKIKDNLSAKNTNAIPDTNCGYLLKTVDKKCKEAQSLEYKINAMQCDKINLIMKLQSKDAELQKVNEEYKTHLQYQLQTKNALDNYQKEIRILKRKLSGTDKLKNLAKNAELQKKESQRKIQNLEKSLAKEKQIVRELQEYIVRHFYKDQNSTGNDFEHYDFLKRHSTLQKLLRYKVDELKEKELLLMEKDKMLDALKNSKVKIATSNNLKHSTDIRKRIKDKEKELVAL